ncbi:3-hydroxy-5-phosphonooxypentane-2,4-dione thiolase [Candidatus Woesearchaeota archaeon]|nr:3-hydroxy-5-phosphonooxypentane-2,4-dione thiolase [Candidatus Woesearchaeota archaeon]
MSWGVKNRLSRIIRNGRCVMLAVDHGYFLGPTSGLENLGKALPPLLPHADALMLTRGALRTSVLPESAPPIVLRVSGGPSVLKEDLSDEYITTSVEEAVRLNASAVTMSIFVGSAHESRTIANLGKLVNEAERYGLPVLAVTAVGKDMARDARYLGLCCRMAAEQGAHVVKTYHCEGFEKVVEATPVPLIIAGGKKVPEREALQLARNAIESGAIGVDMGRNIFQSDNPTGMIRAVRAIVHENASVDSAYDLYKRKVPAR